MVLEVKVGIVSPYWPPHYGGGEKYAYNMALGLRNRGVDVVGITPTPEKENRDNGLKDLTVRLPPEVHLVDNKGMNEWFENALYPHLLEEGYDVVILNNCRVPFRFFTKVVEKIKGMGMKCGVIHHDLGHRNRQYLEDAYRKFGDWDKASEFILDEQRKLLATDSWFVDESMYFHAIDSPLYFGFDFVIGNTDWSCRFIDVHKTKPKFVLHPILELPDGETTDVEQTLKSVNLTMLNPLYHKGRSYMSDIINDYSHDWTYRVLLGSYGDFHKDEFRRMIEDSWPVQQGRVELVQYVEDIFDAWRNTDIFLFPSRYEGYGMAAVEPMLVGTPVIAHDYPSIVEAVGDGAYLIPWGSDSQEWYDAIEEVLYDLDEWKEKATKRGQFLMERQEQELDNLVLFLKEQLDTETPIE